MSDRIQNAPQLLSGLDLYDDAFNALESERPTPDNRIPRHALRGYAEEYGFSEEQFEMLVYVAARMDTVLLKWRETHR